MSGKYKLPKNIERDILKLSSLKIQIEDLDSTPPSHEDSPNEGFGVVNESDEDDYDDDDDYTTNSYCDEVSFIEFAIINAYLHDCFKGKQNQTQVSSYGVTDSIGRLTFGGSFEITGSHWFFS